MSQLVYLCPILHAFNLARQHLSDVMLEATKVAVAKIRGMAIRQVCSDAGELLSVQ
jgi:hypothetical protein